MSVDLETRVRLLEAQVGQHVALSTERFESGNKAFNSIRESIGQLSLATTPKPVSLGRVVGITLAIVMAAGGALWGLSTQLADRPTLEQMRNVVNEHSQTGHPSLNTDLAGIKQEQAVQRVKLDSIEQSVSEIKSFVRPARPPR